MQSVENQRFACAQWDYEAIEDNELTFKTGDYIQIVSTDNEDWWEGIINGFQGFFPANRVEEVKNEKELEIANENLKIEAVKEDSPIIESEKQQELDFSSIIESKLPEGWKVEYDSSGKIYYKNILNNEVSYELPVYNIDVSELEEDLPNGWKAEPNNGNVYYYNIFTNETSWEKPKNIINEIKKTEEVVANNTINNDTTKVVEDNDNKKKEGLTVSPEKVIKSGKLSIKYEKGSTKFSWKQCFIILCQGVLLIYKEQSGKSPEGTLPAGFVQIRNCVVEKATKSVTKKKNGIVLNSASGELILLFCSNESEVNSWIESIRQCSGSETEDLEVIDILNKVSKKKEKHDKVELKQSKNKNGSFDDNNKHKEKNKKFGKIFGNKKVDSSSTETNNENEYLIFGGSLEEQVLKENTKIPNIVKLCINEIERRGIEFEGIYRLSGNSSVINKLKGMFNRGETVDLQEETIDLPVIASLLKLYFRELKDSLIPSEMYDNFMDVIKNNNHEEKMYQLNDLIHQLPQVNYDVLEYLIKHLKKVSNCSETNKMEISNLAIVFGPTLISRSADKNGYVTTLMSDMSHQNRLIECIIMYEDWLFQSDTEEPENK